jgi:hypothetical protein
MNQDRSTPDQHTVLADAWGHVVGGMEWLRSVLFGEFADHRPLSAVVADMLVSFIPGVVIVTSARDAVAVILRLATHQEKRDELMEWVLLCACLIVIALPVAMAAGSAVALGVGAVVGGVAGSELGAALRAVMLMLIKEASKLVELVRFLQRFMKGDILKFLRGVRFARYEKALIQAVSKIIGKLVEIVEAMRMHLESLQYFDSVKTTVATLADWEKKFYNVQRDALKQVPKALVELDARLAKVLAQTAPKEVHTVAAGVQADKTVAALPARQHVMDTAGRVLPNMQDNVVKGNAATKVKLKPEVRTKPKKSLELRPKEAPDPVKPCAEGVNTKKQVVVEVAAAADRERITRLSNEAREAEKGGNKSLATAKLEEARDMLLPYLPKAPEDTWDEVIKRLDVSSPKDGAFFWSGTAYQAKLSGHPDAARALAEKLGGVTLETTPGGRIIDGWEDLDKFSWNANAGSPPWASDLWKGISARYANGAVGKVILVQTPSKLWDPTTIWHTQEKPILNYLQEIGQVSGIDVHVVNTNSLTQKLSEGYVEQLLKFDQRP